MLTGQQYKTMEASMSLQVPKPWAISILIAIVVAVVTASCGESDTRSGISPSSLAASTDASVGGGGRLSSASDAPGIVGPADEVPPPPGPAPEPAPAPPAPPGPPAPPAPDPALTPGPWPAPPQRRAVVWTPTEGNDYFNVRVDFNPVPFSGIPVPTSSCSALSNTWYYKTILQSRTGNPFRVVERENYFDGFLASRSGATVELPAQQPTEIQVRWCSGYGKAHTAQHRFRVVDQNGQPQIINGPLMQLQQNPTYVPPPPQAAEAFQPLLLNPKLVWGD
jgi:hypothetical protein